MATERVDRAEHRGCGREPSRLEHVEGQDRQRDQGENDREARRAGFTPLDRRVRQPQEGDDRRWKTQNGPNTTAG